MEVVTGGQPFCFGVNVAVSITGETPTNLLKSAIWTKISGFFPIRLREKCILRNIPKNNRRFSAY